jgi:DNA-binding transcriptional regulator YdaS (Cro superfamily)
MNLKAWLDDERGRYTALAVHLGVTVARVSQMAEDGVPPKFMLSVRDFTDGAVSLEELVQARTPDQAAGSEGAAEVVEA